MPESPSTPGRRGTGHEMPAERPHWSPIFSRTAGRGAASPWPAARSSWPPRTKPFSLAPAPFSGNAMGAAFGRWDRVAVGASAALLVCEIARTWAARGRSRRLVHRVRRIAAIRAALCAVYIGTSLSPRINQLHADGVHRGDGERGAELDAIHKRAELVGKLEAVLALGLVALHVFTLRTRDEDDDDADEDAPAPLAPGPR